MAGTFGVAHLGERRLAGTSSMRPAEVPAKRRRSPKRSTPLPRLNPGPVMPIFPFAPVGNIEIVLVTEAFFEHCKFRTRGPGEMMLFIGTQFSNLYTTYK